ncbi:MAG: phosphate-starvation-inducible protein PsiE, partial [Hyphomicrobiales bacterium]
MGARRRYRSNINVEHVREKIDIIGLVLVEGFHLLALFAIGAVVVWAAVMTFISMFDKSHASIEDVLLLFIYLELGAMVGIYFKTSRMPVRFLI